MENSIFSDPIPAAEFDENPRQEKEQNFVMVSFERTKIDVVREISESGKHPVTLVPMIRQTTVVALIGVPMS